MAEKRGFTLIELLVVIAIIGILSSVVLASLNTARGRARDSSRQSELRQMQTAMQAYYLQTGNYPGNPTPGSATYSNSPNWQTIWQPIIDAGFIGSAPTGPTGSDYRYFTYGAGSTQGAMLVTVLEAASPSNGYPGTCRPFSGVNWCRSDIQTREWCLCNPY
ncbi:MAG TPA: type II secretion system protein [Candidatus Paceibacterota bacterium]